MQQLTEYLKKFKRFLCQLQGLSEVSYRAYERSIKEFSLFLSKDKQPDSEVAFREITSTHIEDYLEWCYYKKNSNSTRRTKLIALNKFFFCLVYYKEIDNNPATNIPSPKITKKFVQKFTKEDVIKLFSTINLLSEKGLRDISLYILAVFCGLRTGEIINLTLGDIIDHGHSVDVNVIESKHDSSRTVPLWKFPSAIIKQYFSVRLSQGAKIDAPFLVSYNKADVAKGRQLTPAALDHGIKRLARLAGVRKPKIHMHMFRATHASDLRNIYGYDTPAIAQRLGHKHISSTDHYFPCRDRVPHIYPSLAIYWKDFNNIWKPKEETHEQTP